jgi:glycosyltransferase involved in cell wall biosynthesis
VVPAIAARYGGPSAVALGACRALQAAGLSVLIATTDANGSGRLEVEYGRPQTFDGVPVIFFPRHLGERFKWSRGMAGWLDGQVSGFDLVDIHAIFSHSSLAAGGAAARHGIPYVVRPHGMLDPWSLSRRRWQKRVLLGAGVRRLLARAAAIQYTTAEERRLAEAAFAWLPAGTVVPLGIDDELFAVERPAGTVPPTPYVLALSRLDAKKGLDLLIQAFHEAAQAPSLAGWRLVIAGDGSPAYVAHLHRLAGQGAARDRIGFPGWVQGAAKAALLAGAGLFAAPSQQENFGVSVAEALACRVPLLVTPGVNLAGEAEAAGAAWVVRPETGAIRDALLAAAADPGERARRGLAAARFAARFRWPAAVAHLMDLYERILGASPRLVDGSTAAQPTL